MWTSTFLSSTESQKQHRQVLWILFDKYSHTEKTRDVLLRLVSIYVNVYIAVHFGMVTCLFWCESCSCIVRLDRKAFPRYISLTSVGDILLM